MLRAGSTLVGWIVIYAHCVMLGVAREASCASQNAELWRLTAFMIIPSAICICLSLLGLHLRQTIRWLALPLALLVPLALWAVFPYFTGSTLDGAHLCHVRSAEFPAQPAPDWHRAWAPLQLLFLLATGWVGVRYWWPKR